MASSAKTAPARAIVRHVYSGKGSQPPYGPIQLEHEESVRARQDAFDRLRELYNQGMPFFSKEVFRHILAQLDHCRANPRPHSDADTHVISIPALDGTTVKLELETGKPMTRESDIDFIVGEPHLDYHTLQHLTRSDDMFAFVPSKAYCSTTLLYPMKPRLMPADESLSPPSCDPVDGVQMAFDAGVGAWKTSDDCKRLQSFLGTTALPKITKIVAFACGSMANHGYPEAQARSAHQHALILTVRDILINRSHADDQQPEVKCFAQDPYYSEGDEQVLQKAGVTVLGDPLGFLEVDDETMVLSFCPDIPVRQIITDIARPAVMIWDHVKSEAEAVEFWNKRLPGFDPGCTCDPESSRLREMVQEHYLEPVPLGPKELFGAASVYVRRE